MLFKRWSQLNLCQYHVGAKKLVKSQHYEHVAAKDQNDWTFHPKSANSLWEDAKEKRKEKPESWAGLPCDHNLNKERKWGGQNIRCNFEWTSKSAYEKQ